MITEGFELADYACRSAQSRGRAIKEQNSTSRTEFQRDRDRIIHSSAFRRLEYKTQVFVNHEGDLFRTRLTHTLEVAQIGRTTASLLKINPDLTEAMALAHDLGHTPFGHAGQTALNRCMQDWGGFEHNLQSLRIVDLLEEQYPTFDGLNLTWETREGILKHCSRENALRLGALGERFLKGEQPSLEAQLVNIADAIAYSTHDIDDGLRVGYLDAAGLESSVPLYERFAKEVRAEYPNIAERRVQKEIVRRIIGCMVDDLVTQSQKNIDEASPKSVDEVRALSEPLVSFSEDMLQQVRGLKSYLMDNLYRHYKVLRVTNKSAKLIKDLFDVFYAHPELLPPAYQKKVKEQGAPRVIADYIAGMTDRYAQLEYSRVLDPTFEM
ncbi:deoxyguanosinetriphosphate triphosphohydrolase [Parasutterella muris]|uniref:Deoxyguanosinetriphosphate triphosphohydrolase-like protein n=1 Tax=Parasutterella muris TaxID=2565572 RepID=A0A6L6YHQ6_9BURK|nr:deoxyguanosinetriphosphate triphosphohydrolase [Parasutterella muris]MVX57166.1 deoxyguanosinetriphosphate triphosphohydrolase [Parasutterella muris]